MSVIFASIKKNCFVFHVFIRCSKRYERIWPSNLCAVKKRDAPNSAVSILKTACLWLFDVHE